MTIDGFNEIKGYKNSTFPLELPKFSDLFFELDPERNLRIAKLYGLVKHQSSLAKRIEASPFKNIRSFIFSWFVYDRWLSNKISSFYQQYASTFDREKPYYDSQQFANLSRDETLNKNAKIGLNLPKRCIKIFNKKKFSIFILYNQINILWDQKFFRSKNAFIFLTKVDLIFLALATSNFLNKISLFMIYLAFLRLKSVPFTVTLAATSTI